MTSPTLWYTDLTRACPAKKKCFLDSFSSGKVALSSCYCARANGLILLDNIDCLDNTLHTVQESALKQEKTIVILFDSELYQTAIIWDLLAAGASKVFSFDDTPFLHQVIEEQISRWQSIESLLNTNFVQDYLVGNSKIWRNTIREMIEIAVFTQSSVLIIGESGTGKEMLSKLVHHFDSRKGKGDLVLLDCTTISPELSGSELFGHERGAFTGANNSRDGAFSLANEGTLFLDEIGELSARMQSELLRVIQEGLYKPVGSNFWKKTIFRLVGATNRTLVEEVTAGRFRLDLYYRLSSWICKVPSLAERKEDIPLLANRFFSQCFNKRDVPKIEDSVMEYLSNRVYQGNVRELQQLVQRIVCQHVGKRPITLNDIPTADRPLHITRGEFNRKSPGQDSFDYESAIQTFLDNGLNLKEIRDLATQTAIELTIRKENGRINQAANRLGITSRAIQLRKLKK